MGKKNCSALKPDIHLLGIIPNRSNGQDKPQDQVVKVRLDLEVPLIQIDGKQNNALEMLRLQKKVDTINIINGEMLAVIVNRFKVYDFTDLGICMTNQVFEKMLIQLKKLSFPNPKKIIVGKNQITNQITI